MVFHCRWNALQLNTCCLRRWSAKWVLREMPARLRSLIRFYHCFNHLFHVCCWFSSSVFWLMDFYSWSVSWKRFSGLSSSFLSLAHSSLCSLSVCKLSFTHEKKHPSMWSKRKYETDGDTKKRLVFNAEAQQVCWCRETFVFVWASSI